MISAPSGSYEGVLVVKGRHVRISDLAIDGSGPGRGGGRAVEVRPGARDVRISRLAIRHVRQTGVLAWGRYSDISVQDSTISGGKQAAAGVVFEDGESNKSSVIRTRISSFRSFGIVFACLSNNDPTAARGAVALDNAITDIFDPTKANGTSEGGIWSGGAGAAIIGNVIKRTGWDGIETVGTSLRVTIIANTVRSTMAGIYLEHATNKSLISENRISKVKTGINVEWRYDGIGSSNNSFIANEVSNADRGLFIDLGDDGNRVERNTFINVDTPVIFQGSSNNVARGNQACGNNGAFVREWDARREDGALVTPARNRLSNNLTRRCSRLVARA